MTRTIGEAAEKCGLSMRVRWYEREFTVSGQQPPVYR